MRHYFLSFFVVYFRSIFVLGKSFKTTKKAKLRVCQSMWECVRVCYHRFWGLGCCCWRGWAPGSGRAERPRTETMCNTDRSCYGRAWGRHRCGAGNAVRETRCGETALPGKTHPYEQRDKKERKIHAINVMNSHCLLNHYVNILWKVPCATIKHLQKMF